MVAAAFVAAVFIFATGPRAPRQSGAAGFTVPPTVRGAFHIHTRRSDGALDKASIATAARRAGLRFAIFTDHGDATAPPDPPRYIDDVLCIDGVEISTNGGHYIALGIPAAPYRLGGDADAVAADVARLGGFGIAAHPMSGRRELQWSDWDAPIHALEWLNADSEWRDEGRLRLTRAVLDYFWRPAGALATLLDRPVAAFARWDQLASERRVLALAGHDAHGGVGAENGDAPGRRLHIPSYESTFRTFSTNVMLARALTGNASDDARELLAAISQGHVFTAVDAVATPAALSFEAQTPQRVSAAGGEVLPIGLGRARFLVRAQMPGGASMVLLRNGRAIGETTTDTLERDAAEPGAYRVEIRVPGAPGTPPVPWLVSNPIFRFSEQPDPHGRPSVGFTPLQDLMNATWRGEASPGSTAAVTKTTAGVTLAYALRPGDEVSQFTALVVDLPAPAGDATAVLFKAQGSTPMRVSVQLRFAQNGAVRWRKSVYVDEELRDVAVPVAQLRPADAQTARPDIARATSLLFVIDLTNAVAGTKGRFTVNDVKLGR